MLIYPWWVTHWMLSDWSLRSRFLVDSIKPYWSIEELGLSSQPEKNTARHTAWHQTRRESCGWAWWDFCKSLAMTNRRLLLFRKCCPSSRSRVTEILNEVFRRQLSPLTHMFPLMLISLTDGELNTDENLSNKWLSLEALRKEKFCNWLTKGSTIIYWNRLLFIQNISPILIG